MDAPPRSSKVLLFQEAVGPEDVLVTSPEELAIPKCCLEASTETMLENFCLMAVLGETPLSPPVPLRVWVLVGVWPPSP